MKDDLKTLTALMGFILGLLVICTAALFGIGIILDRVMPVQDRTADPLQTIEQLERRAEFLQSQLDDLEQEKAELEEMMEAE